MGSLTKHFDIEELACPCCGEAKMDPVFMDILEVIREEYGRPMTVPEGGGYRCPKYMAEKHPGKVSAHERGLAVDIKVHGSLDRAILDEIRVEYGILRCGMYDMHIHFDIAGPWIHPKFPIKALWLGESV